MATLRRVIKLSKPVLGTGIWQTTWPPSSMLQLEFLGFLGLGRRHGHIIWKTRFGSPVLGRWAVVPGFDPLMGHCGVQLLLFKTSGLAQKGTPLDPFDGLWYTAGMVLPPPADIPGRLPGSVIPRSVNTPTAHPRFCAVENRMLF